jgi:hypothetical protein
MLGMDHRWNGPGSYVHSGEPLAPELGRSDAETVRSTVSTLRVFDFLPAQRFHTVAVFDFLPAQSLFTHAQNIQNRSTTPPPTRRL